MPPRKRNKENDGLPRRWRYAHGAYYYQVPPGLEPQWDGKQTFRLGKTLPEAHRIWSERLEMTGEVRTVGELLDRYALEVIPTKAPKTQLDNVPQAKRLRAVFGRLPITAIRPQHFYRYLDKRKAKVAAHRELALLSHAFTKAIEWGLIDRHPTKGQLWMPGETPRTRYIEDWEIVEVMALPPFQKKGSVLAIQAYIRLKLLTGISQGDLLRLRPAIDFQDDGIHVQRQKTAKKTGQRTIYEWTPELRAAVQRALGARPVDIAPYLFCTKHGTCYAKPNGTTDSWKSIWQRFMKRVLAETKVTERFTEHDLRAKAGSDAESLEHARQLLAHTDARTTQRFYRRRPERVKPLK